MNYSRHFVLKICTDYLITQILLASQRNQTLNMNTIIWSNYSKSIQIPNYLSHPDGIPPGLFKLMEISMKKNSENLTFVFSCKIYPYKLQFVPKVETPLLKAGILGRQRLHSGIRWQIQCNNLCGF